MMVKRFTKDDRGASAVEYGLAAALISVAIIGSVATTGTRVEAVYCTVAAAFTSEPACAVTNPGGGTGNGGAGGNGGVDNGGGGGSPPSDVVHGGASFTIVSGIMNAFVSPQNNPNAVESNQSLFGNWVFQLSLSMGGNQESRWVYFGNVSAGGYLFQDQYAVGGLLTATRQTYQDGQTTLTHYLSSNGAYTRRVEFDQATGQVLKVEDYLPESNRWNQVQL